jgi:hypothetical protein
LPEFVLGILRPAHAAKNVGEIEVAFGTLSGGQFRGDQFIRGGTSRGAMFRRQSGVRHAGKRSRGFDANQPHGVEQQGADRSGLFAWIEARGSRGCGRPNQGIGVIQAGADTGARRRRRRCRQRTQRRGPNDGRFGPVLRHRGQQATGFRGLRPGRRESRRGQRRWPGLAAPTRHRLRRPLGGSVVVTSAAGIGQAMRHGHVGTWDAKTVVASPIDTHVGLLWHMAVDALAAGRACLVAVM